jgi:hypothetical protein
MTAGLWDGLSHFMANTMDFASFRFDIIQNWQQHNVFVFVMMLWCIWERKNEKVWEDAEKDVCYSVQLARDYLQQWREVRRRIVDPYMNSINKNDSWLPPSVEEVKCNVDAALFKENHCFGVGMCIRDYRGHFVKANTAWFDGVPTLMEAEAWGIKEAILLTSSMELNFVDIIFGKEK